MGEETRDPRDDPRGDRATEPKPGESEARPAPGGVGTGTPGAPGSTQREQPEPPDNSRR